MSAFRHYMPVLVATTMLAAILAARALVPSVQIKHVPKLADSIPVEFGEWKQIQSPISLVDPRDEAKADLDQVVLYDEVLMRAYANAKNEVVLLVLAYGKHQRQEFKIHRPELCYAAQGFEVKQVGSVRFPVNVANGVQISGKRMLAVSPDRTEAISYWLRIGHVYSDNAWDTRSHIFKEGLQGKIVDGILVRVSQVVATASDVTPAMYELQERFLEDLVGSLSASVASVLAG
ncbi:MAG: exosortase C-terminal domain/associated protein EpsI [Steroidobacteraceae bacterium]